MLKGEAKTRYQREYMRRRRAAAKEPEDDTPDPAKVEENALYSLARIGEHARVFRKWFRGTPLDGEQTARIDAAIEKSIQKLRWAQTALSRETGLRQRAMQL
jgi:hypothetical protein